MGLTMEKPFMIEECVYKIPLILSNSLEPQRHELEQLIISAQRRIRDFAKQHGWENLTRESFADYAEIYDKKDEFDLALIRLTGADPSIKIPITYSAVLENRVIISVSPELYAQNYPEGIEDKYYEKLIAHEIAHRLHIRILDGNEDAMGPIWFFEGFAIYASGQFENYSFELDSKEIWEIVRNTKRRSYKKYGAVFRYFLKKASIQDLIEKARTKNFLKWLQKIENKFGRV